MRATAIALNLIFLILLTSACKPTERHATLKAALVTTNALRDGFLAWDQAHQLMLVERAASYEEGVQALATYRARREPVALAFTGLYRALAIAALAEGPLQHDFLRTALELRQLVEAFQTQEQPK